MWGFFKKKEVVKVKTISITKDKWKMVSNGSKPISIILKDFSIGKYEMKYIINEEAFLIQPKVRKIKLSGVKQKKVYIKSTENTEVEITI